MGSKIYDKKVEYKGKFWSGTINMPKFVPEKFKKVTKESETYKTKEADQTQINS
jgi:hypothetical protein